MDNFILFFINFLQQLPVELTSVLLFIFCVAAILLLFKFFGEHGLYLYNIVTVIAANIQVLRGIKLAFITQPIALGTITFASTYLCTSILTEHYGTDKAKNNIWFCFAAQLLMTLLMIITIGHKPLHKENLLLMTDSMIVAEQAMSVLFIPSIRLLLASIVSFIVSQLVIISSFKFINQIIQNKLNKLLPLQTLFLLLLAMTVDTLVFNLLAWKVLASNPLSISIIFYTYIIWTLITQIMITFLATPAVYISYYFKKSNNYS